MYRSKDQNPTFSVAWGSAPTPCRGGLWQPAGRRPEGGRDHRPLRRASFVGGITVGADVLSRPGFYHLPPHQCRPRKLRIIFHGINAMAHSLRCSSSPQCDRLRWVTLGAPVCSTASPLRGEAYKPYRKAFPTQGGRWSAGPDEGEVLQRFIAEQGRCLYRSPHFPHPKEEPLC